ncbi:MAG: GNAT family N-acetyltransferase [Alphaproteobacteria bacterium]|nr:GNAT family N-acetyltransferase [Alphaproteobacteria bacterium]
MRVRLERLSGSDIQSRLAEVSALRLQVFREWPYLYDGDLAYEAEYLATFSQATDAVIVCAYDGDEMVGAATAAALAGHTDEFVPLFASAGYDPAEVFYCGESVLLPRYRGQGIGHRFFDFREDHARGLNTRGARFRYATFCGVVRPKADPRKPAGYRPLDAFWRKRGYEKASGLVGEYAWREIGDTEETPHPMQFWLKRL